MHPWSHEISVETHAKAAQIWALWADPALRPRWDEGVASVTLAGPFATGTTGVKKTASGRDARFALMDVSVESGFWERTRLPLVTLDHMFAFQPPTEPGRKALVKLRVEMKGWAAPLLWTYLKRSISRRSHKSIRALVNLAEGAA